MLRIAVVAYNFKLSCEAMKELAYNDVGTKPKIIRRDEILMEDGTRYKAFSTYNYVRGHCIDQIVIVDDSRWMVYDQQFELIDWIRYRIGHTSCVPEEFQELRYEW